MSHVTPSDGHVEKLLGDRVEFKLYAAGQHLNRLRGIKNESGDIAKDDVRIQVEMEVDCFLSQLVGAIDSLLFQINDRLDLGIPPDRVYFTNVQSALTAKTKKIDLLSELDRARQPGNWYHLLSELRNQSVHGTFLKKMTAVHAFSAKPSELRFVKVQREIEGSPFEHVLDMEVIPYLEKSLEQVRDIISSIKVREPLLQQQQQS